MSIKSNSNKKSTQIRSLNSQEARLLLALARKDVMRNGNNNSKTKIKPKKNNNMSRGVLKQKSLAAAYATGQVSKAPAITYKTRGCRIVHRELITSLTGSAAFSVQGAFNLNPGMRATFPWLSLTAQNWEKYRFKRLRFCYYTRTGSNVPGSIMLIPDYDAADGAPISEQIASSYEDVAEDAPWKDICCSLNTKSMHDALDFKFIRTGVLPPNLDVKTYDAGTLFVATIDGTAVPWGKLWVEYDVEFENPALPPTGGVVSGGSFAGSIGSTPVLIMGTNPATSPLNNGIFLIDGNRGISIQNPGAYIICIDVNGTGIAGLILLDQTPLNGVSTFRNSTVDAAGFGTTFVWELETILPYAQFTFAASASTISTAFVRVGQCPVNSQI